MASLSPVVRLSLDVALEPAAAFETLLEEMERVLRDRGVRFGPETVNQCTEVPTDVSRESHGDADGKVIGRVTVWEPGRRLVMAWRPAPWNPDVQGELEIQADALEGGTRLVVEQRGWLGILGEGAEPVGWFASALAGPLLAGSSPNGLGDWLTDRVARQPSGPGARETYRDPLYHRPMFRAMLEELALGPDDSVLDVGCGGGALLADVLAAGCHAAGIDHSAEMVSVAQDLNRTAIADGRLEVQEGDAAQLPFADETFTVTVMHAVLGFLPDPVAALAEMRRVLAPGGRLMVLGSDPAWKGTPAAPEPMASRLRFYDDEQLAGLAVAAGFARPRVERRPVESHARAVGVPEEDVVLFTGPGPQFLFATKD